MLYFNSTNELNIWNGSAWQVAAISASGLATIVGTETLTNKTLTAPKINENVAVTSTATELNLLDGKAATNLALLEKQEQILQTFISWSCNNWNFIMLKNVECNGAADA